MCVFLAPVGSWPVRVSPLAPSQRQLLFDFYATSVPDVPRWPLWSRLVEPLCLKSALYCGGEDAFGDPNNKPVCVCVCVCAWKCVSECVCNDGF